MKAFSLHHTLIALFLCVLVATSTALQPHRPSSPITVPSIDYTGQTIAVQFGSNIAQVLVDFTVSLLHNATNNTASIQVFPASTVLNSSVAGITAAFSFGNTQTKALLIDQSELDALGSEGYIIRSATIGQILYLVGDGNAISPDVFKNNQQISNGAQYGLFRMLETLGFPFFHPLRITAPPSIDLSLISNPCLNVTEKPYWPIRGWHYHTEHLLELTDMFNGFGLGGVTDEQGFKDFLPYYQSFLFWLVANHQNRLEWLLLCAQEWEGFCNSTSRQSRQLTLTSMAREVGIGAGADIPIAEEQQHAWRMISNFGSMEVEIEQIQDRIDWLMEAGFDFVSSENGYSEFTHPNDVSMLQWMNASTSYLEDKYSKKMYIKCHCSTGQIAQNFTDPYTGQPLNFNFLPIFADPRLGIYPHTVQVYRFDDPAPTYGNTNFMYMFDFLTNVTGSREVVYHGETDYWVNYDIDVPIFYPLYADSRLYDLRKIANFELSSGRKMQGQMNFDSGWEWGSWLQDVVTARAAWNPRMDIDDQFTALVATLTPITSIFGPASQNISDLLQKLILAERYYLVEGLVGGVAPENITNLNGQAYLEGWDTWSEIGNLDKHTGTQPSKYSFLDVQDPFHNGRYWKSVEPLLAEMDSVFGDIAQSLSNYQNQVPTWTLDLYNDIVDSAQMLALRSAQVHGLYDYAAGYLRNHTWRASRLEAAQLAMISAQSVVSRREAGYRIDPEVVAGWRPNPTCYSYGYLWTVHSLFYFWRDYEKAIDASLEATLSPCFMNIINPADVGFGEGLFYNATEIAYKFFEKFKWTDFFSTCLVAPSVEPKYGPI